MTNCHWKCWLFHAQRRDIHLLSVFGGGRLKILQQGFDKIFQWIFHQWWNLNPWAPPRHLWDVTPYWSLTLPVIGNSCTVHMVLYTPKRILGWSSPGSDQTQATTAVIAGIFLDLIYFQETWGLAAFQLVVQTVKNFFRMRFPFGAADYSHVPVILMIMLTLKTMTAKGKPKSFFLCLRKQ